MHSKARHHTTVTPDRSNPWGTFYRWRCGCGNNGASDSPTEARDAGKRHEDKANR